MHRNQNLGYGAEMKRKGSISNPIYPLPVLRASPLRAFHAAHGSPFQFPCSTPQPNNDSSCRKRPSACRKDASDIPLKDSYPKKDIPVKDRHVIQPNNAKTSEFAFFKKFKEDAKQRVNSSPLRQKEIQSKKFKSSDQFREKTSLVKDSDKDFTSHFLVENVTPVNLERLHSGLGKSFKISEVDVKHAHATSEDIQSEQRNMENNGTYYSHSNIFDRKRQKLRNFTRNMSFHETGEACEKGYGFVSMLLRRLMPQNNSVNDFEQQLLPARSLSRLDRAHYLDNESSPCHRNKSRGRDLSDSYFLTNSADDNNFHLNYRTKESYCELEEVALLNVNDSSVTAVRKRCRPLTPSRFKPRGGIYDEDEPLGLRELEPKALLLGRDTNNITDESSYSFQHQELNSFAMPPISFAEDHQPNFEESFGAVRLCSSPFPSTNSRNFYSLPYSSLASYEIHRFSTHDTEKKEEIAAAYFNNFNLNLSYSYIPKCPSPRADYVDCEVSSNSFNTQSSQWFANHLFETVGASGFVLDLGREYFLSSENHCKSPHLLEFPFDEVRSEEPCNEECNYGSSDNAVLKDLWPFWRKDKVCHFQPDNLSWDAAENEINVDNTELNYI